MSLANDYTYIIVPASFIDKGLVEESKNRRRYEGQELPAQVSDVRMSLTSPSEGIMTFDPGNIPPPVGSLKRYDSETILDEIAKNPTHWNGDN